MRNISIFEAIVCFTLFARLDPLFAQSDKFNTVARAIFVTGEATRISGTARSVLKIGDKLAVNDTLSINTGAKVKLLFEENKSLITILPQTRVKVTDKGVELVDGLITNIIEKKLKFLKPDPELENTSRQLGGTYAIRGIPSKQTRIKNLNGTFCRETKPVFHWQAEPGETVKVELSMVTPDGVPRLLWERQTRQESLDYPQDQPELERGRSYRWVLSSDKAKPDTAYFYLLSLKEEESFSAEMAEIKQISAEDKSDSLTADHFKKKLLIKYHLEDELKELTETQGK